jgi:hypothetical protein
MHIYKISSSLSVIHRFTPLTVASRGACRHPPSPKREVVLRPRKGLVEKADVDEMAIDVEHTEILTASVYGS